LSANGTVGSAQQALLSGGGSGNVYWGSVATGVVGSTTQIAFNNNGTESGDANLLWYTANGTITIANGFILGAAANEVTVNTTTIQIGNSLTYSTVNSTVFSQTANNATNLGGTASASYAGTSNVSATNITAGTLPWAQAPSGTVNTAGNFTLAGNITYSANITLNTTTNQLVLQGGLGAGGNVI